METAATAAAVEARERAPSEEAAASTAVLKAGKTPTQPDLTTPLVQLT